MELIDFLAQTQMEVRSEIGDRMGEPGVAYPYPESVFAEHVMQHMAEIAMTFDEPVVCHFERTIRNARLRLSGYAISEDVDQLDLFVSLYSGVDELTPIPDAETKTAADQCVRFIAQCVEGKLVSSLDESDDAYTLVLTVQEYYKKLDQIRIFVLTDRQAKSKNFKSREVSGKTIKLEVMDIERLHRHWSEGKPRDEIVVDFMQVCGDALPCVYVKGQDAEYDYALTAFPGEALRFIYDKFGARLLEANVRSFLSVTGKVNKGIRDTLKTDPERFMAYNNGIVVVADSAELGRSQDGSPGLLWLKGMQIVNGGQTTASIYFTKKKNPEVDLTKVMVPVKVIVIHSMDSTAEEVLISDISRYANSQNAVKMSDLSANKPFHVELERISTTTYCPDGVGRWFYERAAGSYNVLLAREGTTPAKLAKLKDSIPTSRKITKTDLAKFLNVWDKKPDLVSRGSQKNFDKFMEAMNEQTSDQSVQTLDPAAFKKMIAKAIVFKKAQTIVRRPNFMAFQANIVTYLIALLADRFGDHFDFDRVWDRQDISPELGAQLLIWAREVDALLHRTSGGKMISEWAKRPECWEALKEAEYSAIQKGIPEIRV